MKRYSAFLSMMGAGLVLLSLAALPACGTRKKVTESQHLKLELDSVSRFKTEQVAIQETKQFGDSLKGSAFIPSDFTRPVVIESKGLKMVLSPKPVVQNGAIKGFELNYETTAKAVSTTSIRSQTSSSRVDSLNKHAILTADTETDKPPSFTPLFWVKFLCAIIGIIALILFGRPLYNLFRQNGK